MALVQIMMFIRLRTHKVALQSHSWMRALRLKEGELAMCSSGAPDVVRSQLQWRVGDYSLTDVLLANHRAKLVVFRLAYQINAIPATTTAAR